MRVKGHLPLVDVAVVVGPQVLHLDKPGAVERASHEVAEVLAGVIDLRHIGHVGGVDDVGVHSKTIAVVPVGVGCHVHVLGLETVAIGRVCVLVAQRCVVGPDVVPGYAHRVLRGVAGGNLLQAVGKSEVGAEVVGHAAPAVVLVVGHDAHGTAVGAVELDADILNGGVLDLEAHIQDVVGGGDGGVGRE